MLTIAPALAPLATLLHDDGTFSWTHWDVHPSVLIGCLLFTGGYLAAAHGLRRDNGEVQRLGGMRIAAFLSGVAVIFVALNGPIHDLSDDYLFSAHMVQHLLLMMVAPPLLLLGTPGWLLRPIIDRRGLRPLARFVTRPLIAYPIYNIVLIGWHFPRLYNLALTNHDVHIVQHLMFMTAAVIMWWPIVNPLPNLTTTLASPLQVVYLFAMGIPMSALSAMVTFADVVLYAWYAEAPRIFELSALADQQLGGVIMWVPGALIFWTAISVVFYRWSKREQENERHARLQRHQAAARLITVEQASNTGPSGSHVPRGCTSV